MSGTSATRQSTLAAIFAVSLTMTVSVSAEESAHWSYSGKTGPEKWGSLEHDYDSCAVGHDQSPIDISDDDVHAENLPSIDFAYQPSPLRIVDNGHTIQVNYAPGSFIDVGGRRYQLMQFHFHKPSEEEIDEKRYDMVAHLVHKGSDGRLAVVAVLLAKGHASPLIDNLWSNLPAQQNQEIAVDRVTINAADLLPENHDYYTFTGSLTTPPCTEGVTWFVLQHPTSVSAEEIARFGAIYPMNARPVQPLYGREVRASH
ncbi:carbonic anhydrase [Steroidobacter cummioxidans]|uniref:carbonic anhydrase n=1 Tax=Steroidobacter cummioxidans TaxID=1803913 RepID=UPI000E31838B|nr:carbonic anhydrase [Steroidobacter cummioxidans]